MTLIDTSAWIAFFRGPGKVADQVDALIDANDAAICGPIWTELRRGFRNAAERRKVLPLLESCSELPPPASIWSDAGELGFVLSRKGITVKSMDLLIATYALNSDVGLLTADRDFEQMRKGGIPLRLA